MTGKMSLKKLVKQLLPSSSFILQASSLVFFLPLATEAMAQSPTPSPTPIAGRYIPLQGQLTEQDGDPLADGTYTFLVNLYREPNTGQAVWTDTFQNLPVIKGA